MKNIQPFITEPSKSPSIDALSNTQILKNTRFINDVISRSCRKDGCIYIKPVNDDNVDSITPGTKISQTEYRALTGRRLKNEDIALINFPMEWIAECIYMNQTDALHIASSMYKSITLQTNMNSSLLAQRFPLSIKIILHSFLLHYFANSNLFHTKDILSENLIHIISQEIKMEYYKISSLLKNSEEKEDIISFLSSYTSFDDAYVTTEIIASLLKEGIPPSLSFQTQLSSLQLMSQSWENAHKMLTYILFNTHSITTNLQ